MRKQTVRASWLLSLALASLLGLLLVSTASAQTTSSSPNYSVNESFFGTGGELDAASATYRSKMSAGELTVGAMRSTLYSAQAGFNTDRTPYIAMAVLTPSLDMGVLNSSTVHSGTAQFWVRAYLAEGYVVRNYGGPPVNGGHTMTAPTTLTASTPGTEQFGINLAVNTTPSVGADPTQTPPYPADPFGFGQAATGYNTPNQYKYNVGDTIALSTRSSSDTTYTISYIMNISGVTPGGTYTMGHILVVTATF